MVLFEQLSTPQNSMYAYWRCFRSFLGELAIAAFCLTVAAFQTLPQKKTSTGSLAAKRRLDVPGLIAFALTMLAFLILLDLGVRIGTLKHPLVISSAVAFLVFGIAFILIEAYWATQPIIPLSLIKKRSVGFQYLAQMLNMSAQFSVRFPSLMIITTNISR